VVKKDAEKVSLSGELAQPGSLRHRQIAGTSRQAVPTVGALKGASDTAAKAVGMVKKEADRDNRQPSPTWSSAFDHMDAVHRLNGDGSSVAIWEPLP
jgi:hypothetical protein